MLEMTDGHIDSAHFGPDGDTARHIASYCDGKARVHVYTAAFKALATTRAELAAKNAEIARLRAELSSMATKYSWAVDTFGTGFSGYEAVLLHQKRYAEEGHPSNWRDSMKEYAARAALTDPTDEA